MFTKVFLPPNTFNFFSKKHISNLHELKIMSTPSERMGVHQGERHDAYIPIGIAIMMTACLITIFIVDAQGLCPPPWPNSAASCVFFAGYGGGSGYPYLELEGAGIIWGGTLVAYFVFIWRAQVLSYKYSWYPTNK